MFHRIIFVLLIVSSLSCNFKRFAVYFQSFMNIACRSTQNAAHFNIPSCFERQFCKTPFKDRRQNMPRERQNLACRCSRQKNVSLPNLRQNREMHSTISLSTVDFNRFKNVNNGLSKKNLILFFLSLKMLRMTAWKWKLSPSKLIQKWRLNDGGGACV